MPVSEGLHLASRCAVETSFCPVGRSIHEPAIVARSRKPRNKFTPAQFTQAICVKRVVLPDRIETGMEDTSFEHAGSIDRAWSKTCKGVVYGVLGLTDRLPNPALRQG